MKWNELYEKNKYRKYSEIEQIEKDIILKARLKNFISKYNKILAILIVIICLLLIMTFRSTPKTLLLVFCMLILMIFCTIFFNTFTIIFKNNKMIIKQSMQTIEISSANLKNVYIENKKSRIFFNKRNSFSLIILYNTPKGNIININLPIMFLNKEEFMKFLENFKVKKQKSNNNIIKAQKYELKRLLIKLSLLILVWLLIILTILIQ